MVTQDVIERVTSYIKHQGAKSREALAELVEGSQQRLIEVIGGLTEEQAVRPERDGEWCVRELVRHAIDVEGAVADAIEKMARGAAMPPRTDLGAMIPEDGRPFAKLVAQLRATQDRMLSVIRELPDEPNLEITFPHPFFGPLSCREWAAFQRVHDEDHIQHARKIIAAMS